MSVKLKVDWAAVRLAFISGADTYEEIGRRFGIAPGTLRKRAQREGWVEARHAMSREATGKAQAELLEKKADALKEFNESDLRVAKALRAIVVRNLASASENSLSPAEIRSLASAAEVAQRIGRLALGVSTDNHGHGGPDGIGPVSVANVSTDEYLKAREKVLEDF